MMRRRPAFLEISLHSASHLLRSALPLIAAVWMSGGSATAWGDSAASPPVASDAVRQKAQRLVEEGATLHQQGDDAGALARFQAAYGMFPNPKLLFNIAQMLADLGNNADAADAFQQFLDGAAPNPKPAQSEFLETARKRLVQLQPTVGRLRLSATPPSAVLAVDGRVHRSGLLYLSPGAHQLVVSQPGWETSTQIVAISAGHDQVLEVNLVAVQIKPAPEVQLEPTPSHDVAPKIEPALTAPTPLPERPANVPARIAFGVSAALAVGAAVMTGITWHQYANLSAQPGPAPAKLPSPYATELTDARLSDGLWAGAGIAAAAGVGLWLFAAPSPGGGGEVTVGGRF